MYSFVYNRDNVDVDAFKIEKQKEDLLFWRVRI